MYNILSKMPTSEAQKRACRNYYKRIMDDPVKRQLHLEKMRVVSKERREKIKKEHPEKIEYERIRATHDYHTWKKDITKNDPEKYREYLFKARVKYWYKLRETKTAKDYDKALRKCRINNPDFYEKLLPALEKMNAEDD